MAPNLNGLMQHQARGVEWLLKNPRGMLAWEMGVGKTAAAARAWELTQESGPLLVICLASARANWAREIRRFSIDPEWPPTVQTIDGTGRGLELPKGRPSAVVVNYDKFQNPTVAEFLRRPWGAIVLDEAHFLKSPSAGRTEYVYGSKRNKRPLINYADRVWPLTGTPMPNHPAELWTHAFNLWPDALRYNGEPMDLATFERAFCNIIEGEYGRKIVGGRNLGELKTRLSPYLARLKRCDVLTLPPLRIDSWPLAFANWNSREGAEIALLREKLNHYGHVEALDGTALDAYLACINAALSPLATLRRETGLVKAYSCVRLLTDELEQQSNQKTVVFAHHRDSIEILTTGLAKFNPAVIHGGVKDRQAAIDRFQHDPTCRVFVGQLQAAGASINLQAADNVVFVEASWSPGENDQALSRVYRAGQTKPVLVRFTYIPGSIDEAVNRALARKAAMIAQVVD